MLNSNSKIGIHREYSKQDFFFFIKKKLSPGNIFSFHFWLRLLDSNTQSWFYAEIWVVSWSVSCMAEQPMPLHMQGLCGTKALQLYCWLAAFISNLYWAWNCNLSSHFFFSRKNRCIVLVKNMHDLLWFWRRT